MLFPGQWANPGFDVFWKNVSTLHRNLLLWAREGMAVLPGALRASASLE